MESGFIYLWYDRKHKRYYLGKHWGPEDDGYVCSSTWMKNAYKRRPRDFRRRILERVTTSRKDLGEAEYRWGSLIKESELGKKYYNLKVPKDQHWSDDQESRETVSEKISKSKKGSKYPNRKSPVFLSPRKKKGPLSEEHRKNLSKAQTGKPRPQTKLKGRPRTEETKELISAKMKENWNKRKS